MEEVYLKVYNGKNVSFIGSWEPATALNNNFTAQEGLGWQIFMSLFHGADKVEAVIGDQQKDFEKYVKAQNES